MRLWDEWAGPGGDAIRPIVITIQWMILVSCCQEATVNSGSWSKRNSYQRPIKGGKNEDDKTLGEREAGPNPQQVAPSEISI